ncbi:hypothetical protein F5Y16DRAFT_214404 [Xylariaceae sp. FL0255]|nr:hypothetical protein F5Y16DRAFT_214404 [Xylariaceae sp. FL0255]
MAASGFWHPSSALPEDVIDLISSDESDESGQSDESDNSNGRNQISKFESVHNEKSELIDAIEAVETRGDFSTTKQYTQYANPGLQIDDKLITLPLDPAQVPVIRGAARQAPFGRGDQTIVDTSVRKTWELNISQFRLVNPAWMEFIKIVLNDMSQSLGMTNVNIELYKLLLYEEGSFFKRHKDSEKAPGMIGTLSICLPSHHKGGEVHLSHAGKDHVIDTSKSFFDVSALAWYADVTHEIKLVQEGYRLVLIYNIIQTGDGVGPASATAFDEQDMRIDDALARLISSHTPRRLIQILEHKYSQANLCLSHLKGRDRAIGRSLEKSCSKNNCYLFLCNVTKVKSDWEEYGYGGYGYHHEDRGPSFAMDTIATSNGQVFASEVELDQEDVLSPLPYGSDRDADSESEGEDTGNEGAPIEYRYHDSALVIVPKNRLHQFFEYNVEMKVLYDLAMADFEANAKSSDACHQLASFLAKVVQEAPDFSAPVIATSWKLSDHSLFDTAVRAGFRESNPSTAVKDAVLSIINGNQGEMNNWDRSLDTFVKCHLDLTALSKSLDYVGERLACSDLQASFQKWRITKELQRLEEQASLEIADHDALLEITSRRLGDHNWVQGTLIPKLRDQSTKQLQSKIICSLLRKDREGVLPTAKQSVVDLLESGATQKLYLAKIKFTSTGGDIQDWEESERFLQLLDECLLSGLQNYVDEILGLSLTSVKTAAVHVQTANDGPYAHSRITERKTQTLAEQMLSTLSKDFEKHKLSSEPARDFFLALFRKFILRDLPRYPKKLDGYAHRPRGCQKCKHCTELDQFLTSKTQDQYQAVKGPQISAHLKQLLPPSLFDCAVVDVTTGKAKQLRLTIKKLGVEHEKDLEKYKSLLRKVISRVEPFRTEYVKEFLGDAYRENVMLIHVPHATEFLLKEATSSETNKKRRAEEELQGSNAKR